jgi:hypothetical protein
METRAAPTSSGGDVGDGDEGGADELEQRRRRGDGPRWANSCAEGER